jgi:hypothetical protein
MTTNTNNISSATSSPSKVALNSHSYLEVKPTTVSEIEQTMETMDKLYKTSFSTWIKDEENIACN